METNKKEKKTPPGTLQKQSETRGEENKNEARERERVTQRRTHSIIKCSCYPETRRPCNVAKIRGATTRRGRESNVAGAVESTTLLNNRELGELESAVLTSIMT